MGNFVDPLEKLVLMDCFVVDGLLIAVKRQPVTTTQLTELIGCSYCANGPVINFIMQMRVRRFSL